MGRRTWVIFATLVAVGVGFASAGLMLGFTSTSPVRATTARDPWIEPPCHSQGAKVPSTPLPADTASELADLMARVQRLEANQGGLSLLTTFTCSTNDVYAYSSSWVTLPDATPPSFTLVRPTPILLVASLTYFGVGGTAVNLIVSGGISATNVAGNNPNGNDIAGNEMYTTDGVLGNDSPPGGVPAPWASLPVGTYTGIRPFLCPAGTWYAHINYKMFGGATTTITNNGSSVDVFQLPG